MNTLVFEGDYLVVGKLANGMLELKLDRKQGSTNVLDHGAIAELSTAIDLITNKADCRGLLISSAKDSFLAGADLSTLQDMLTWDRQTLVTFCSHAHAALGKLGSLPVPVACAINGNALGGGLELALCADHRVLADNGRVGFPEAGLGILPALGGTVRTARLASTEVALGWLLGAKTYKAGDALSAGMVDGIAPAADLQAAALDWLNAAADDTAKWTARRARLAGPSAHDKAQLKDARPKAEARAGHYPAALAILELLEQSAGESLGQALTLEAETFARLMHAPTTHALINNMLAGMRVRQRMRRRLAQSASITTAGVVGAGIMGGGIAYATATGGVSVILKDIREEALDKGIDEARKLLGKQVSTGRLGAEQAEKLLGSIKPTLEFTDFKHTEIVVEAVVEDLGIKQRLFAELERHTRPGTVLASNTSSLSITDIAANLQRPQHVVGMHFFNPVPIMPLVEIIRGPDTHDDAIVKAISYAQVMGKTPLVVKDCAGFLVNRILGAYFTAFLLLLRDGVDHERIDRVMEAWGWPMGPSYLLDVAGLDTIVKALAILGKAYPSVMGTSFQTAAQVLVAAGRLGQKSGAGFYRYTADTQNRPRKASDPTVATVLEGLRAQQITASDEEIVDRLMLAMVLEAERCVDEQVVEDPDDVDLGMRLGTGFPAHHGGPLWLVKAWGARNVVDRCARYRPLGGLYEPGPGLLARARA